MKCMVVNAPVIKTAMLVRELWHNFSGFLYDESKTMLELTAVLLHDLVNKQKLTVYCGVKNLK